jgi:hypothetical protein
MFDFKFTDTDRDRTVIITILKNGYPIRNFLNFVDDKIELKALSQAFNKLEIPNGKTRVIVSGVSSTFNSAIALFLKDKCDVIDVIAEYYPKINGALVLFSSDPDVQVGDFWELNSII